MVIMTECKSIAVDKGNGEIKILFSFPLKGKYVDRNRFMASE